MSSANIELIFFHSKGYLVHKLREKHCTEDWVLVNSTLNTLPLLSNVANYYALAGSNDETGRESRTVCIPLPWGWRFYWGLYQMLLHNISRQYCYGRVSWRLVCCHKNACMLTPLGFPKNYDTEQSHWLKLNRSKVGIPCVVFAEATIIASLTQAWPFHDAAESRALEGCVSHCFLIWIFP